MAARIFEQIIKHNDFHDPATGRFAPKGGGSFMKPTEADVRRMQDAMGPVNLDGAVYFGALSFRKLNDSLREGTPMDDESKKTMETLDRNMKPCPENIMVDRFMFGGTFKALGLNEKATDAGNETEAKKAIGRELENKGYTSTTYDASQIPFPVMPGKTSVMHIKVPKGTDILIRPDHKEGEILLGRGANLKITGVRKGSMGEWDIDCEVVSQKVGKSVTKENNTAESFSIFKTDDDKRLVFGWASVAITVDGEQLEDRQADLIDPEDLEEAAYEYVLNFRDTGEEHIKSMRKKGKLVESCVFTEEKQQAMGIPPGTLPVAWWIGFKIEDDAAWARVKNGTYKMFSIEGKANRIPVEKSQPVGCGVLVVQNGKILSGTRIERGGRGKVCGPGGHIEAGESPEEAARRETEEEFGITCEELTDLGTIGDGTSAIFLCTKFSGTPKTDEKEMTEPKWRTIEELQEEELFGPFGLSLEKLETSPAKRHPVAKTFSEVIEKFNPFHDARGRFASGGGGGKSSGMDEILFGRAQFEEIAEAAKDIAEEERYEYAAFGIRVQETDTETVGEEMAHRSRNAGGDFDDAEESGEELDGVSTIGIDRVYQVANYGGYFGKVAYIVGGSGHTDGYDPGEIVIEDPVVLAKFGYKDGKLMRIDENAQKSFSISEVIEKFNPFHDARGRFASSNSFASYSANPKSKAGAMAISRSAQAGHGTTFNVHRESQGENIDQNYKWLNGGPGAKQLAAQGQLASQQPKQPPQPPKPQKNYDAHGFADYDDADYHQLHSGRKYYQQQQLTAAQQKAAAKYLEANPEPGSLYSHSQNMNYMMASGQQLTGKYKQTHDDMMSAMHNIGYNVTLTRYDHDAMVDGLLKSVGVGKHYENLSQAALQKALVGTTLSENKFISTSYNDFQNAANASVFTSRAVKINYKVKANTKAMMPGVGPGGDFGEIVLAPTSGKITGVRFTGKKARKKGTQSFTQQQIEIDIEIGG